MEDDSEELETHPLFAKNTRQSCFSCKLNLEYNPSLLTILQLFLGLVQVLHFCSSIIILSQNLVSTIRTHSCALVPLLLLSIELLIICILVLLTIISDIYTKRLQGISLWQRQAIGRLIRNLIILIPTFITLLSFYFTIDDRPLIVLKPLSPFIVLTLFVSVRFILISSNYSLFWVCSSLLLLSQEVLLVFKIDFNGDINWKLATFPIVFMIYTWLLFSGVIFYENTNNTYYCIFSFFAFLGIGLLCGVISWVEVFGWQEECLWPAAAAFLFLSLAGTEILGSFLIDIIIGHVDIDVAELKTPAQSLPATAHSV